MPKQSNRNIIFSLETKKNYYKQMELNREQCTIWNKIKVLNYINTNEVKQMQMHLKTTKVFGTNSEFEFTK